MHINDATEVAYKNGFEAGKASVIKYGKWIAVYSSDKDFLGLTHENCGRIFKENTPYCPMCGAKMSSND